MKPLGIIRRFDELGRIVIPKECRRAIGLEKYEGVPMEIFANDDGEIVLRPYGINEAIEHGTEFLNALAQLPSSLVLEEERDLVRNILSRLGRDD